ncbi:glycosyltransferase [Streptomyces sp. SID3212]|uniref:glycosyltransferase n=1 Tax=Streptomyces sp. SID3212 TaxID=2690259 RepID=UPI00136BCA45|nr:glycosyltransferase [Streptomyces sp. SID3212]MYV54838.1 glycosyltransferase [Streptomyces sp. SID3212]
MRVLIVSDNYAPNGDGIAASVISLATGLCELGHEVTVIAPRANAPLPPAEYMTYFVPSFATGYGDYRFSWPSAGAVKRIVEYCTPDIVHVHSLGSLGLLAASHCRRLGIKCVLTWHTDLEAYRKAYPVLNFCIPLMYLASVPRRLPTAVARLLLRTTITLTTRARLAEYYRQMLCGTLTLFDHVITPSAKAASSIADLLPGDSVSIIPTAPIPAQELDAESRRRLHSLRKVLHGGDAVICFVGRLSKEKNLELLLRVMARHVLPEYPGARLNVIGGGRRRNHYERLTQALQISHAVTFSGPLPREIVGHVLKSCTVLAHPALSETQGMVIDEAALAGVPAVVLDPELAVRHAVTGYIATSESSLGTELVRIIRAPEIRRRLGVNARRAVEKYTSRQYAARVAAVYLEVVGRDRKKQSKTGPLSGPSFSGDRSIH